MLKIYDKVAPTYDEARKYIGGWIERVNLPNGDALLVDEEGLLKELDVNPEASKVSERFIVGNALLVKKEVRGDAW